MPKVECGFPSQPATLLWLGPTLQVQIGFDPKFQASHPPNLPDSTFEALVDTGATQSAIDESLASLLKLPIINQTVTAGAHGSNMVNVNLAQMIIPSLGIVEHGAFCGVNLVAGGQKHVALLGRSFLGHMSMNYDGSSGSVIISV